MVTFVSRAWLVGDAPVRNEEVDKSCTNKTKLALMLRSDDVFVMFRRGKARVFARLLRQVNRNEESTGKERILRQQQ